MKKSLTLCIVLTMIFAITAIASGQGESCGTILDGPCDAGLSCYDDPSDNCDPLMGGADCAGVCSDGTDQDNDGLIDEFDNCPTVANADQLDSDGNGLGDACDTPQSCGQPSDLPCSDAHICVDDPSDSCDPLMGGADCAGLCTPGPDQDGDGITDSKDNCPQNANADQTDSDGDGAGNACDATPYGVDTDTDGVDDSIDNCPLIINADQADADSDGIGDVCEIQAPACGGFANVMCSVGYSCFDDPNDNCNPLMGGADCNGFCSTGADQDGDGIMDTLDNCPGDANADQADINFNGVGDACEIIETGQSCGTIFDGPCPQWLSCIDDPSDNCNPLMGGADCAGVCSLGGDQDNDGLIDELDNCASVYNPDQLDTNGDGFGDVCVDPNANLGAGATIGSGTIIGDGATIGDNAMVGSGSTISDGANVQQGAVVGDNTAIGQDAKVGQGTTIGDDTDVGDNTNVNKDTTVGNSVDIGNDVTIQKNVMIGDNVVIGDRTIVKSGTVISDNVVIGTDGNINKDVTIGAGATIGNFVTISQGSVVPAGATIPDGATV